MEHYFHLGQPLTPLLLCTNHNKSCQQLVKKFMKNVIFFTVIKFLHLFQQNMFSRKRLWYFLVFGTLENVIQ